MKKTDRKVYIVTNIIISYYTANEKDWVSTHYTPYNPDFVKAVKKIPTAHYNMEEKSWCCSVQYGNELEATVKKFFPDMKIDIQEHRVKDLYAD